MLNKRKNTKPHVRVRSHAYAHTHTLARTRVVAAQRGPSQAPDPPPGHGLSVCISNADCAAQCPSDPHCLGMMKNTSITHESGIIPVQATVTGSRLYFR